MHTYAVNGERSDHSVYGWGGCNGRVYQKAYVEFFIDPKELPFLISTFKKYSNLSVYAVDSSGTILSDDKKVDVDVLVKRGVTALTWGVFPDKEILQPTVFDPDTFVVWSKEAFDLWTKAWAAIYDDDSESCSLLYDIHDTYYLVAVIDNDYIESNLFGIFAELIQLKVEKCKEDLSAVCIEEDE
jgi:methylenetetrahydrofolate reductase (NADPH)